MVFTYYRIYVVAAQQTRSLKLGTKQIHGCEGDDENGLQLRIHRGKFNANVSVLKKTTATNKKSSEDSGDEFSVSTINTEPNGISKGWWQKASPCSRTFSCRQSKQSLIVKNDELACFRVGFVSGNKLKAVSSLPSPILPQPLRQQINVKNAFSSADRHRIR